MSKASRDFFEGLKEAAGKVWDGATPAFELGAEEVSRALFNHGGNAYVFHGDTIPHEQSHQTTPIEAQKEVEDREI